MKRLLYLKQAELWEAFKAVINIIIPWNIKTSCYILPYVDWKTSKVWPSDWNPELWCCSGLCQAVPGTRGATWALGEGHPRSCSRPWNWAGAGQFLPLPPICLISLFTKLAGDALYFGATLCSVLQRGIEQLHSPGKHSDTQASSPTWDHSVNTGYSVGKPHDSVDFLLKKTKKTQVF